MYSTFLTSSPGSVLFCRSNLLKRKDLCFSCLRLDLIRHRRSLRSSHLFSSGLTRFCRHQLSSELTQPVFNVSNRLVQIGFVQQIQSAKKKYLCFSCLRLDLIRHRRSLRYTVTPFSQVLPRFCRITLEPFRPNLGVRVMVSSISASPFTVSQVPLIYR